MYIYGASGHGKVIKDVLESNGITVDGFIDDSTYLNEISGLTIKHSVENDEEIIVGIGDNDTRKKLVEKITCKFYKASAHKYAVISPSAELGEGTVVMAGAIVNADSKIGKHCIINTGASVDHECIIDDYVHISPHVTLCGNVSVGEGTWIGAGATIIPGMKIGKWSQIGAGSVVVNDIPDGYLAYGNPCRLIKKR